MLGGARLEKTITEYIIAVSSDKQREMSPDVVHSDLVELAAENSAFAFDLYQILRRKSGKKGCMEAMVSILATADRIILPC